jgi:WD40 repeat protein
LAFQHNKDKATISFTEFISFVYSLFSPGELLYRLDGHQGRVADIFLSPDQTRCLSRSNDTTDLACILWDLETRSKVTMFIFDEDVSFSSFVFFSYLGELVAVGFTTAGRRLLILLVPEQLQDTPSLFAF